MLHTLPSGFALTGAALAVVDILALLTLFSRVRRFDGLLLWMLGGTTGAWLVVDHVDEVAVLWVVTKGHGLTVADLAAVPSVLIAGALLLRTLRRSPVAERSRPVTVQAAPSAPTATVSDAHPNT